MIKHNTYIVNLPLDISLTNKSSFGSKHWFMLQYFDFIGLLTVGYEKVHKKVWAQLTFTATPCSVLHNL